MGLWMRSCLGPKQIELTVDDLRQLEIAFTWQWHRAPMATP